MLENHHLSTPDGLDRQLQGSLQNPESTMTPIDPVTPAFASPMPSSAPPYVNEEPNLEMVQQGLDLAEDEVREAVTDAYEEGALLSEEPQEALDDIDYEDGDEEPGPPELTAIHEAFVGTEEEE